MSIHPNFLVVGNWKLNKGPEDTKSFLKTLKAQIQGKEGEKLVVLPSALSCFAAASELSGSSLRWGGQNCFSEVSGAFTGENSAVVLKEMGAAFCLVGHSERRLLFMEPEDRILKKVRLIQDHQMTPILCVGETLDDRKWGRTMEVVRRQIKSGLSQLDVTKPVVVAYEPVWAIGTGEVATPDQVEEVHTQIRNELEEQFSAYGLAIPILYGGSVKSSNCRVLSEITHVNGFLVGGASLDPIEFLAILRNSAQG